MKRLFLAALLLIAPGLALAGPFAIAGGGGSGSSSAPTGSGFVHVTSGSQDGAAVGETGTGNVVRATSPTLANPALGTPASGTLTNATGLPPSGVVGTAAVLGGNTFTASQTINPVAGTAVLQTGSTSIFSLYTDATSDGNNTFVGFGAGNLTMGPGGGSVFFASQNTAVGNGAFASNTTGYYNTAIGSAALAANTSGPANTAVGYQAMKVNTTGLHNVSVGWGSLMANTTGGNNVAVGATALSHSTTGSQNVAIGSDSLTGITTQAGNTMVGYFSGGGSSNGSTGVGFAAMGLNTTGASNTAIGYQAGYGDGPTVNRGSKVDTYMTFVGYQASRDGSVDKDTVLTNSIAIGKDAQVDSSNKTVIGNSSTTAAVIYGALTLPSSLTLNGSPLIKSGSTTVFSLYSDATSDGNNTFVGFGAGNATMGPSGGASSLASQNTAVGKGAFAANTTGYFNTAVGSVALASNTTGPANTAVGYTSMQNNSTGNNNTAVGWRTLTTNTTGTVNVAVGAQALALNTTGSQNVAIGASALASNVTHTGNTMVGYLSGGGTGNGSTGVGFAAMNLNTTGSNNTAVGYQAGYGDGPTVNRGSKVDTYMVFVGYQASRDGSVDKDTVLTNSIAIGKDAQVAASNTVVIGNTSIVQTILRGTSIVMGSTASPASGDACTAGSFTWDTGFVYVCTASGAWKRAALTGSY